MVYDAEVVLAVLKAEALLILMSDGGSLFQSLVVLMKTVCIYICPSPLDLKLVVSSCPFSVGGDVVSLVDVQVVV